MPKRVPLNGKPLGKGNRTPRESRNHPEAKQVDEVSAGGQHQRTKKSATAAKRSWIVGEPAAVTHTATVTEAVKVKSSSQRPTTVAVDQVQQHQAAVVHMDDYRPHSDTTIPPSAQVNHLEVSVELVEVTSAPPKIHQWTEADFTTEAVQRADALFDEPAHPTEAEAYRLRRSAEQAAWAYQKARLTGRGFKKTPPSTSFAKDGQCTSTVLPAKQHEIQIIPPPIRSSHK